MRARTGILLINLGTPEAPTVPAVRKYLKEFLCDPDVITLPFIFRYLLVYFFILPFRPKQSAHAYQQIWTDQGSPLLVNSAKLKTALEKKLGGNFCVALGMRYGRPAIQSAIDLLLKNNCEKIIILPLFPQYANATSGSALKKCTKIAGNKNIKSEIIRDFCNQDFYINSYAEIIKNSLEKNPADFLMFSYHGLPERQIDSKNYQAQCFSTTKLITEKLNLGESKFATTFQSRLGRTKWIGPYTDLYLLQLIQNGVKKLSVVCPSFVCDCLETLEEINIRLKNQWLALGGESFQIISCLNDHENWINNLSEFISQATLQ